LRTAPATDDPGLAPEPWHDAVTIVVTAGTGSLDYYAQKLAEHLPVRKLVVDTAARSGDLFGHPLLSAAALRRLRTDRTLVRTLRAVDGVLHLPNHHLGRYGTRLSRPYVLTVHDLIRLFDRDRASPLISRPNTRDRLYLRLDRAGIRRAAAIVAPSQATKRDLVRHLEIPEERITVVHAGVDHDVFRPVEQRAFREPYVLVVGSEHPRKNLATLFRAFARLKGDARFADLKLVKVGSPGSGEAPFRAQTVRAVREAGVEDDVVFVGRREGDDLAACYSGAECFVLPSLYEGFGLPLVEAMACGCPVIVSNVTSLPEVAGGAALLVDPDDARELADAMDAVLTDRVLRADLRERGLARAAEFSWARAARETLAVYARVL
jgi:glycosyltransferase involved in cell wall biosynthesis